MPTLYSATEINAPRQLIWQLLHQKQCWMYWNTFLYDSDPSREFAEGRKIILAVQRLPGDEMTEFQPQITRIHANVCLQWVSIIPGFVCESSFELQDLGGDRTQYLHIEQFSGRLTRLFLPFIRHEEQEGMRRMTRELKRHAETVMLSNTLV